MSFIIINHQLPPMPGFVQVTDARVWGTNVCTDVYFNDFIKAGIARDIKKSIIQKNNDLDAKTYRIANITIDLQEALKDKSMSKDLGLCSDPKTYRHYCFDKVDYDFTDFKGLEKRIKTFF